mgnify:CR=1 FL=1
MSIKEELLAATKLKKRPDEDDQDFYQRLIDKVSDLSDDGWGELSDEAQKWVNAGVKAIQDAEVIPGFSEDEETTEADTEAAKDEPEPQEDETMTNSKKAKKSVKTTAKPVKTTAKPVKTTAKPVKTKPERKPRERNTSSRMYRLAEILLKKPSTTYDEASAQLAKHGDKLNKNTFGGNRSYMGVFLRAAKNLGLMK